MNLVLLEQVILPFPVFSSSTGGFKTLSLKKGFEIQVVRVF